MIVFSVCVGLKDCWFGLVCRLGWWGYLDCWGSMSCVIMCSDCWIVICICGMVVFFGVMFGGNCIVNCILIECLSCNLNYVLLIVFFFVDLNVFGWFSSYCLCLFFIFGVVGVLLFGVFVCGLWLVCLVIGWLVILFIIMVVCIMRCRVLWCKVGIFVLFCCWLWVSVGIIIIMFFWVLFVWVCLWVNGIWVGGCWCCFEKWVGFGVCVCCLWWCIGWSWGFVMCIWLMVCWLVG